MCIRDSGDRTKTDLPYLENTPGNHEWYQLRHQKAMNSEAVVRLAEASQDRYGFKDFKLKGEMCIRDRQKPLPGD